ncbi:hypothetical protein NZK35_19655 [Stieleria sp. ICT_E10.1]|uniref:hypothetical protein n=1 Tax=Stieleria sedimenti TaxID=2976331 RepID=UPI0021800836|nr:hypothetical protein [Stieleria sedimenti]MCS7468874.1 hypothetical protein [Stieleria sedimenti]
MWTSEDPTLTEKQFLENLSISATVDERALVTVQRYDGHTPELLLYHKATLVTSGHKRAFGHNYGILGLASTRLEVPLDSLDDIDPADSIYRLHYAVYERKDSVHPKPERGRMPFGGVIETRVKPAQNNH